MDTEGLVLLGSVTCPPCAQMSAWLDAERVPYRKYAIDAGGSYDEELCSFIVATTGQSTVPQLYWRGRWLSGGLDDVKRMLQSGEISRRPA